MGLAGRHAPGQDYIPHWILWVYYTLAFGESKDPRKERFDVGQRRGRELVLLRDCLKEFFTCADAYAAHRGRLAFCRRTQQLTDGPRSTNISCITQSRAKICF